MEGFKIKDSPWRVSSQEKIGGTSLDLKDLALPTLSLEIVELR